jgi:hypothetical protein
MNKFLDESNIVKKETKNENVVLSIEDESNVEETIQDFHSEKKESINNEDLIKEIKALKTDIIDVLMKINNKDFNISVERETLKSKKDIIVETLNRFQNQIVLKEIDLKLYGNLFDNANNTNERNRYKLTMDNLKDDIRTLNKKIDIVKDMLK